jgi:hypothetical protein
MSLWAQMIMIVVVLSLAVIVSDWLERRRRKQGFAHESGELPGLKEGQTIMAVVDKKKTLYFCIGRDEEKDIQKYEKDVK